MNVRFAMLLTTLLPLAGCFGMCGFSPEAAQWQDPALFGAMPAPGVAGGRESVWAAPERGLPFATVVDPAWGPTNLTVVERQTDAAPYEAVRVMLTPDGLGASRVNATPESVVAVAAEAFLANATTLSGPEREAVVQDLLASGHEEDRGYMVFGEDMVPLAYVAYGIPLPGGLRLDGLYGELAASGDLQVGLGGAQAGPWVFGFSHEKKTLRADGSTLEVGPTGVAQFTGLRDGERSSASYEKDLRAWLTGQGLPRPGSVDVQGSIC